MKIKKNTGNKAKQKEDKTWKKVPPKAGNKKSKEVGKYTYHWCEHHVAWCMSRLCIHAGIPRIPRNPQEPGFQKKGTTLLFLQEHLEKARQTMKERSKTPSFFSGM